MYATNSIMFSYSWFKFVDMLLFIVCVYMHIYRYRMSMFSFQKHEVSMPRADVFCGVYCGTHHRTYQAQCTEWIILNRMEIPINIFSNTLYLSNDIIVTLMLLLMFYIMWHDFFLLFLSYICVFVVGYWCVFSYFPMLSLQLALWLLCHHVKNNKLKWTKNKNKPKKLA